MAKEAAAKKVEIVEERAKVAPITKARFGLEAEYNTPWRVNVPMEVTPKDTLKDGYWQHLSAQLTPGDTITVMPDDMAWRQVLHVAEAGTNHAYVNQMELYVFDTATSRVEPPSEYTVEWGGSHHKWRFRLGDRMLKDGFATRGLAAQAAANHKAAVDR